jgi:uncharacterized protein YdiU (UPF0061 family)
MNDSSMDFSLNLEHSYAEQLPGFFAAVEPAPAANPSLLHFNRELATELGLNFEQLPSDVLPQLFSGNALPSDAQPIAQAYAGHQFGNFVPQLGDGRALLLGEVLDQHGKRRDLALKGSGVTPFSRGGDGKAAVGPVLREYLIGEAMHALGIPTTRALAAVATGEPVTRDCQLPGAVLTRVASSHIRVGTFQYFAARGQVDSVRKLADYVIQRHYPEVSEDRHCYLSLLRRVVQRQAGLIARWMLVGFIHGVMNTDNMAVSGETIDYGPCAFMEAYDPDTVFSSIDHAGRYAYGNQPTIAVWNLARFAETLLPILGDDDSDQAVTDATTILDTFMPTFQNHWYNGARTKLGLVPPVRPGDPGKTNDTERELIDDWFRILGTNDVDYTLGWRYLADAADGNANNLRSLISQPAELDTFLERWHELLNGTPNTKVATEIRATNPIYIPRNHLVEEALAAASDDGNLMPFENLLQAVRKPFTEDPKFARFALPASTDFTANYRTFCGT